MSKTPRTDALLNTTYIGDGTHFVELARQLEAENAELRAKIHEDNVILEGLRQDHAAIHDLFRRTTGYTATDYIIMREEIKDAPRSNREWRLLAAQERARAEKEASENAELREGILNIARQVEGLKMPCSMDPESPQAIRNGTYMSIALNARALLARVEGK